MADKIIFEKAAPGQLCDIIEHINFVFSYAHGPSEFMTMLPKVYGPDAPMYAEHFIAREDARIRGAVALLPTYVSAAGQNLSMGYVGSVSVHPYTRGRGYMKSCMAMAQDFAHEQNMDILALGGQRQRYEYFGFVKGGYHTMLTVTETNVRHALSHIDASLIRFVPMQEDGEYMPLVRRLHESAPAFCRRPENSFCKVASSYYLAPFAIYAGSECAGYLIASSDKNCIQEIRLSDENHIYPVIKSYLAFFAKREVSIKVSPQCNHLLPMISRICENMVICPDAMYRILHFDRVTEAYLALKIRAEGSLPAGVFNLGIASEGETRNLSIRVENATASARFTQEASDITLSEQDAADLLLSPCPHMDLSSLPPFIRAWFPLPVCIDLADCF